MSDFLDIDDAPALPVAVQEITNLVEQTKSFEASWRALSDRQRKFLQTMEDNHFNERRSAKALSDRTQTYRRWHGNTDYALCLDILRRAASGQLLKKEPLILRHNELVESLMTEKPVLYMGSPVIGLDGQPMMEIEAGAAAKVNMDLIELGGHKPKEAEKTNYGHGPALVIQVVNAKDGTVQIAQVNNGIEIHQPTPAFLEIDDVES
jgi:hypothetical protein